MENASLSWSTLARRQWPLTLALAGFTVIEAYWALIYPPHAAWWLFSALPVGAFAVLAPRRPVDAALAAAAAAFAVSALFRLLGFALLAPGTGLVTGEIAAFMALVATVIRQARPLPAALSTCALVASTGLVYWLRLPAGGQLNSSILLIWGLVLALSIGTGLYFRARDRERRQAERNSVTVAQQAERLALARELHDVVAHYVTGMIVHAQAAEAIADKDPKAPRQVLPIIAESGNEALVAMRRLVGSLRGTEAETAKDSGELAEQVTELIRQVGGPVELTVALDHPVPLELGRSVLRLVQESLTNSRKHAVGVNRITVDLRSTAEKLRVRVLDDGTGQQAAPVGGSGGFGLIGMRERVALLGGTFSAGPVAGLGWLVDVELPIAGQ